MPESKFQKMIYALITVVITVCAFVFYSLYVVNGNILMTINNTKTVLDAINIQGGIYMLGDYYPIWFLIVIEFICAYSLELLLGSSLSFKIASKKFKIKETNSIIFELAIICSTVFIMCPLMSLIASILYYPYYNGFDILTLIASFLKLLCINFPFAFFSQIFFIQPLVKKIFSILFKR